MGHLLPGSPIKKKNSKIDNQKMVFRFGRGG